MPGLRLMLLLIMALRLVVTRLLLFLLMAIAVAVVLVALAVVWTATIIAVVGRCLRQRRGHQGEDHHHYGQGAIAHVWPPRRTRHQGMPRL